MRRQGRTGPRADAGADTSPWHAHTADAVLRELGADATGLSAGEVAIRQQRYGRNELARVPGESTLRILVNQLASVVVLLLVAAALVALLLGDALEAAAIGAVLLINTGLGFVTELRARRALEALLSLDVPRARVMRDGALREVDAATLVPGDVIEVEAGEAVPADARLLEAADLQVREAALTGESMPESKATEAVDPGTPLADRTDMVYKGTTVLAGRGRAVVVGTGMRTEVGRIGTLVGGISEEPTPLERRLDQLGHRLVWLTLAIAAVVVGLGALRGRPIGLTIETGIALAIAAVPEGLPVVATIALAIGLRRMVRRRAVVRRLPAVEALGSTTVVCTDKTGTLTTGEMTVTALRLGGERIAVTGAGLDLEGALLWDGEPVTVDDRPAVELAVRTGVLASRAELRETAAGLEASGDPMDAALLILAAKAGRPADEIRASWPEVESIPFSSERQFAASFHRSNGELRVFVKGAPDRVLDMCDREAAPSSKPLDGARRAAIREANERMAERGLRVLALAAGRVDAAAEDALRGLDFVGLVGFTDPPAPDTLETVERFRGAGIRTAMLTGDQRATAEAVARQLGVLEEGEVAVTARELATLEDPELEQRIRKVGVFCRVSPADKLRIVTAYQRVGEVVAMLGDGVNDAAALKKADVGVAMGRRGTDIAKETAAVVLQDDRFPTIAAAIEEGRVIFDNIRKFVFYLFSCNLAEVLTILVASTAMLPLPLRPLQILWLNIVTDTFPALALAVEPAEPGVMRRPPRDPEAALLSLSFLRSIAMYGALITAATLGTFVWALRQPELGEAHAMTVGFMTLALAQIFHLGNGRSRLAQLTPERAFANRFAIGAVILAVALQLLAVYLEPLARILGTVPLRPRDWIVIALAAAVPAGFGQLGRWISERRSGALPDDAQPSSG